MRHCPIQVQRVASARHSMAGLGAGLLLTAATTVHAQIGAESLAAVGPDVLGGFATTHVIVKLAAGAEVVESAPGRWSFRAAKDGAAPLLSDAVADLLAQWQTQSVTPVRQPANQAIARATGLDRFYRIQVPAGTDAIGFVAALNEQDGLVELAELDAIGGVAQTVPNDEAFGLQYGPSIINATFAWDITTGADSVTLAVLDTGTEFHIDLQDRLVDGQSIPDPINGNANADVCASHGTHVSGIAGATGNNVSGIAGMNWAVNIMPIQILEGCTGPESFVADGITYAVDAGADLINMSLQYSGGGSALQAAVAYAYASDVVMIAASGNNEFTGGVAFPGRFPETITVAGTTAADLPPTAGGSGWTSNSGPEVDIAAPGDQVYSLIGSGSYGYKSGTSMSTPHVSGLVAMMLAIDPTLTTEEIRGTLIETAVDLLDPGFDEATGWGRIDANAALIATQAGAPLTGDLTGDGVVGVADLLKLIAEWGGCKESTACLADLNGDGVVGAADMVILLVNWSV